MLEMTNKPMKIRQRENGIRQFLIVQMTCASINKTITATGAPSNHRTTGIFELRFRGITMLHRSRTTFRSCGRFRSRAFYAQNPDARINRPTRRLRSGLRAGKRLAVNRCGGPSETKMLSVFRMKHVASQATEGRKERP
jgi:hypothetical protein